MDAYITAVGITLGIGLCGALFAKRLKLPAPYMTGSMLSVLIFGLISGAATFPRQCRPIVQMIAGGSIGANVNRSTIAGLRRLAEPVAVYVAAMLLISVASATLIAALTSMPLVTALLSCAPGGVVDMAILSYDFGANASHVTVLQIARLIIGIGVFPTLTQVYLKKFGKPEDYYQPDETLSACEETARGFANSVLPTFACLAAGGLAGLYAGLPAGALTCSMIAVAAFQVRTGRAYSLARIKKFTQIVAGAIIGSTMTKDDVLSLVYLAAPLAIIFLQYLTINYAVGPMIARRYRIDTATMLLSCTPAGVSDMALIAGEMGGDQAKVAVFQVARLFSVLIVFPFIVRFSAGIAL